MSLPLTKTMHPDDLVDLVPELVLVDQHFTSAREQHPARRWEYAMALRSYQTWQPSGPQWITCADVGGAGSPFRLMINPMFVIDSAIDSDDHGIRANLAEYVTQTAASLFSCVFCLSVLEHVDDLDQFLYHLSCLVAPGGLLFLTMDCWDQGGPDTAHFHWMRKRIFSVSDWARLIHANALASFTILGAEDDWVYHGHQLYGSYSFASLALVKRS